MLRVVTDSAEQGAGRTRRRSPPLLPVPQRSYVNVEQQREVCLRKTRHLPKLLDRCRIDVEYAGWLPLTLQDFVHLLDAFHQGLKEFTHSAVSISRRFFEVPCDVPAQGLLARSWRISSASRCANAARSDSK